MSTQLSFSAGLRNVGRFDFTYDVPNGADLSAGDLVALSNLMKTSLIIQWDSFENCKVDSIDQVLGRCLMSLNFRNRSTCDTFSLLDDVANTLFDLDLLWCLEEDYAREVAGIMGVEVINEDTNPQAWVEFKVEFHSVLAEAFFHGAKQVEKDSPTGPTADYTGNDLYNAIGPDDKRLGGGVW